MIVWHIVPIPTVIHGAAEGTVHLDGNKVTFSAESMCGRRAYGFKNAAGSNYAWPRHVKVEGRILPIARIVN